MDQFAGSEPRLFIYFRLDNEEIGQPTSGVTQAMEVTSINLISASYLSSSTSSLSETSGLQVLQPVNGVPAANSTAVDPPANTLPSEDLQGAVQLDLIGFQTL